MADKHLFPIDIHYNKLLGKSTSPSYTVCTAGFFKSPARPSDWLLDRRHCDSKWHTDSKLVRERLATAVKDLPSSEQLAWVHQIQCKLALYLQYLKLRGTVIC